ncbi:hypothetical protein ACOSQ4_016874 [Xanthoceras sorbifolium]
MLRQEDSLILDCIDAIDDPKKKRSAMEKLLAVASKKPSEKQLEIPKQHYLFQEVIKRVQNEKAATFVFEGEELIDSGADLNCISEGIIPSQYFSKTTQMLNTANGGRILIEAIVFAEKFPDEITDKQQLQRFLGSLNYLAYFYKDLAKDAKPLFARLKKSPGVWTEACTKAVQKIKSKAKELPCLAIPHPDAFKIVETDASEYGYGGNLKHDLSGKTSLEAALPSSIKRVSADLASSNPKRIDEGYRRTTRTLAYFIEAEHWGLDLELIAQTNLRDHLSPTIDSQKSRQWFETILMETGCARITHYYKSNKQISYSKLIILDVFSHQDWGDNLFSKQKFKDSRAHPSFYCFFDYVQAWNEVLNYQNKSYGHSWFIKLSITTKDFSRVPLPCWFQQWLLQYGIIGDALPECVLKASNKFYQHNQKKVPIELSFLYFLWEYQFNEDPFSIEAEKVEDFYARSFNLITLFPPKQLLERLNEKAKGKEVMSTSSSSKEEKEVLSLARTLLKEGTSPATIKSKLASCVIRPTQVDEDEDSEGMSFGIDDDRKMPTKVLCPCHLNINVVESVWTLSKGNQTL